VRMKKARLDLQAALGLGDCFGEGVALEASTALVDESEVGKSDAKPSDEQLRVALRAAAAAGQCLEVCEKLGSGGSGSRKSFAQVLLSDLAVNPQASDARSYMELGLWQKISRTTKQAMKRARGEAAHVEVAFKDVYMGKLTDVFGADIDRLRGAEADDEPFDERCMELVVEALQSGMDVFDEEEKKMLVRMEK
jgi:hypothetical protein